MADKILELYENEKARQEYGARGREAILEKYNWGMEAKKLVGLYDKVEDWYHYIARKNFITRNCIIDE